MLEIYTDKAGQWRWRLQAANGRIVADSAEGYSSRAACRDGAQVAAALFVAILEEGIR